MGSLIERSHTIPWLVSRSMKKQDGTYTNAGDIEINTSWNRKQRRLFKVYDTTKITQPQLYEVFDWFLDCLEKGGKFIKDATKHISRLILKGGRGSGKTSLAAVMVVLMVYTLGESAICFMRHFNSISKGIYRTIKAAIDFLGLSDAFEYTDSKFLIKLSNSKAVIDFVGCDNPRKLKSAAKSPTGYYKIAFGDEIDTLDDNSHLSSVLQTIIRGNAEREGYYYIDEQGNEIVSESTEKVLEETDSLFIGCYNPNEFYNHWSYEYIYEDNQENGMWVHHSDYLGMPREWLGKAFYIEVELLLKLASSGNKNAWNQYLNQYKGLRVLGELQLFNVVEVEKFVRGVNFPTVEEENIYRGMDFGLNDAMAVLSLNFDQKERVIKIFYEIYDDSKDISKRRTAGEIAQESVRVENIQKKVVYCDTDENYLKDIRNVGLYNFIPAKKPKGSVQAGFNFLSLCRIEISKDCPNALREFKNARRKRDKITGAPILDVNGMEDHAISCVRYALSEYITGRNSIYEEDVDIDKNTKYFGLGLSEL